MKYFITKIVAPFLAILVLLSTISWSVEKHLCMGRVMDIAFFHHPEPCGMHKAMVMMGKTNSDDHCCDDESFLLEGQDDLNVSWNERSVNVQKVLATFVQPYLHSISVFPNDLFSRETYPPPLLVHDLNLLHEVFLI